MKRINTILWDVDGTLLDFKAAETENLKRSFALQNIHVSEDQIERFKEINTGFWRALERGEITKEELYPARFRAWLDEMGIEGRDPVKLNRDYQEALGRYPVIREDTVEVLNKLKVTGIEKILDGIFISDVIGAQKPDVRYFEICADNIPEYDRNRTVIIGDSISSDIQGGNNAGITTVWFNIDGRVSNRGLRIDAQVSSLSEVPEMLERL